MHLIIDIVNENVKHFASFVSHITGITANPIMPSGLIIVMQKSIRFFNNNHTLTHTQQPARHKGNVYEPALVDILTSPQFRMI